MIREITEQSGTKIDIEDDGTVKIASSDNAATDMALGLIKEIVAEPEVGAIYEGTVVKCMEFGAFVNFIGKRDGLVHISELAQGRVGTVNDVVNEGDLVKVKVLGIDDRGKVKLSMRLVDQATGEDISDRVGERPPRPPRRRDDGDGDRRRFGPSRPRRRHYDD